MYTFCKQTIREERVYQFSLRFLLATMPTGDRGGKLKRGGIRCVAANCGNTHADGYSMHTFPKEPGMRRKWIDFVKVKRANWPGPSEFSALCSFHFSAECFPFRLRFEVEQMGRKPKKVKLNDDAFPSIHATASTSSTCTGTHTAEESVTSTTPIRQDSFSTCSSTGLVMLSPSEEVTCQRSPPRKIRRGYSKREAARIIAEHNEQQKIDDFNASNASNSTQNENLSIPLDMDEGYEFEIDEIKPSSTSIGCQVKRKVKQRSKYCQTNIKIKTPTATEQTVKMRTIGIQTDNIAEKPLMKDAFQLVRPENLEPHFRQRYSIDSISSVDEPMSSPFKDDQLDPSFEPPLSPQSSDGSNTEEIVINEKRNVPPHEQTKFLVFERNLMELFDICIKCCSPTTGSIVYVNGSMVKIKQDCKSCSYIRHWFSQPFVGGKPAGNLAISSGILFSGSVPSKILRMYKFMNVSCISISTYMNHQKFYLYPAIGHVWHNYQKDYVSDIKQQGKSVVLGGDGRADSPGHSAKYGIYSMLDLDEGVVVDIQLVQSNEVKSSCHMEKEGLIRSVGFFMHNRINIKTIVTDRHTQIVKWIRENMKETTHCYDVWHVAKGLKKKLFSLSKEKDCDELQPWIKSLVNHLYWTAASSPDLNKELMLAKWNSVGNHIINIHSGHSPLFNRCEHGELVGRERQKKWLKAGTKVYEKLQEILYSTRMKKDIPMLSPGQQTSDLEGFHSVINHFAPKMHGFSFHGQLCRSWLAGLHFNENCRREQATTREGKARFNIVYPKYKKGGHTVKKILVDSTFDYVNCLMTTTFAIAEVSSMNEDGVKLYVDIPPPLCSNYERPDKDLVVQNLLSRFNRCQPGGSQCSSDQGRQSGFS